MDERRSALPGRNIASRMHYIVSYIHLDCFSKLRIIPCACVYFRIRMRRY
jgi:hypothetical protein